jgi:hypothetical protein
MKKRVLATVLWGYTMWYAGSMIALFMGVPDALGPVLGAASAAIVGLDPRNVIWTSAGRTPAAGREARPPIATSSVSQPTA